MILLLTQTYQGQGDLQSTHFASSMQVSPGESRAFSSYDVFEILERLVPMQYREVERFKLRPYQRTHNGSPVLIVPAGF
jgi:hypothetical protein